MADPNPSLGTASCNSTLTRPRRRAGVAAGLAAPILAVGLACGTSGDRPVGPPVGLMRVEYADPSRPSWLNAGEPRPLVTSIWYPAPEGSRMERIVIPAGQPVFDGGWAARDAEPAIAAPLPLLVLSHGTGGAGFQMMWLGRALAARGYLVAAVDHHGNTAAEPRYDPRGFRMMWERATDLGRVIDRVLVDPRFAPIVDTARIGAVGFSLGGYTVTALAGGLTDLDRLARFCEGTDRDATCEPQAEYPEAEADFQRMRESDPESLEPRIARHRDAFHDPRIGSVVALAPAPVQAFTPESLAAIRTPFLVVVGSDDDAAPPRTNGAWLADRVPGAELVVLDGAGHFEFLNPCTARGRRFVPVCRDAGEDRIELHRRVADLVVAHFEETLGRIGPAP